METINTYDYANMTHTNYDYPTPFPPVGEETVSDGSVDFYIELGKLSPQYSAESRVRFSSRDEKSLLETLRMNEPKCVGHLWAMYLKDRMELFRVRKRMTALEDGLTLVNGRMNNEADEQSMCSAYEELLETLNDILRQNGYDGYFWFTGRTKTVRIEVQRERVVQETTTVELEVTHGDDPDYDMAYEMASEMELDFWEVQDDHYNDMDYTVIHEETID